LKRGNIFTAGGRQDFSGTGAALRQLSEAGFALFIVSNQSGSGAAISRWPTWRTSTGIFAPNWSRRGEVHENICRAGSARPAQPGRKPSPKFLYDARDEFGVELSGSYMIGDKMIDLECGWNAA